MFLSISLQRLYKKQFHHRRRRKLPLTPSALQIPAGVVAVHLT